MGSCHQQVLLYKFKTLLLSAGSIGTRFVFFKEFVDRQLPDDSAASYPDVIDKTGLQDFNYVW